MNDPIKIWAIWGRQNLLVLLLTALTSALILFPWEVCVLDTVHTQVKASARVREKQLIKGLL